MSVKVLDCTLRDGGYINNWLFGKSEIRSIISGLQESHVNIIECGFIRHEIYNPDRSVFCSMDQVRDALLPKEKGVLYSVMIEQHNHADDLIPMFDGTAADIIRVTFRRKEWDETKRTIASLIEKGYKVCVQPVGTAAYDDQSLISLLNDVNNLKPYAFYLVDTLGVMYRHDMRRMFYLIDQNLSSNIVLGFHSHNNLQMSFSNAQEIIRLAHKRSIIIDSSCYGMGRGVGNLATELILDYINNSIEQRYSLTPVLNIIDKYLMPIYAEHRWGYDLPYFLSGTMKCHPNYAAHLLRKETLGIESIEKILSLLPTDSKNEYDSELIEKMYIQFQAMYVDDIESYSQLINILDEREVVILGSGSSVVDYREKIKKASENRFVISVNFIEKEIKTDALFISNEKRLKTISDELASIDTVLSTSNICINGSIVFNYASLLGEGEALDNAGSMLIRALKKARVRRILLAGFDGYDVNVDNNYFISNYKTAIDIDTAKKKNDSISKQLSLALSGLEYEFITPTKYKTGNI